VHIVLKDIADSIGKLRKDAPIRLGVAVTKAMHRTGTDIKKAARDNIASAGMGRNMQNALRVTVYPREQAPTLDPAIYMTHNARMAVLYEKGGTILGKPLMWLALPSIPKKIGTRRMTPSLYNREVGKLVSIRGGSRPLLGARLTVTKSKLKGGKRFTLKQLKAGVRKAGVGAGLGIIRVIPVFVGIPLVHVKKRFNLRGVMGTASQIFQKHFSRLIGSE
jgi:hypothetical protein